MRLPRDVSGKQLIQGLAVYGYRPTRQTGSHTRLTTTRGGEHHVTVPNHPSLRLGTLAGILTEVADHFGLTRDEVAAKVFGQP